MNSEVLQNNLIKLRQEKGITQKELAEKVNYSDKVISKWERGESQPNIEAISILADYFKVSIDFLVGKDETDKAEIKHTTELSVIKTESPSLLAYLFIVPFAVFLGVTIIRFHEYLPAALMVFGFALVVYSLIISKASFESTYNGTKIKIRNRAFSCRLFIGEKMVSEIKNPFRVNPIMNDYIGNDKVLVVFSNMTSIKCKIFIN
jgi:transcriptional regulator with XRE-family HTH domain